MFCFRTTGILGRNLGQRNLIQNPSYSDSDLGNVYLLVLSKATGYMTMTGKIRYWAPPQGSRGIRIMK